MMHSHTIEFHVSPSVTRTYTFLYNSDLSGDVTITEPAFQDTLCADNEVKVPGDVLLAFLGGIAGSAFASWGEQFDLKAFLEEHR